MRTKIFIVGHHVALPGGCLLLVGGLLTDAGGGRLHGCVKELLRRGSHFIFVETSLPLRVLWRALALLLLAQRAYRGCLSVARICILSQTKHN